jgi:predicted DNA-binding transcriptional regulator AlpA
MLAKACERSNMMDATMNRTVIPCVASTLTEAHSPTASVSPLTLTRREAARLCGISVQTFDAWIRKGILPPPITGTRRWSRIAVERYLTGDALRSPADRLSSPYEQWKRERDNAH